MKKKIEMKDDGKDSERFESLLRKVVSVPKDVLKKEEDRQKEEKKKA